MKKIILILFLIPLIGYGRIIPKTSREHNPAMGANSLILYGYNNKHKEEKGIDLQELYLIFGGDILPMFNSMIFISISQDEDKSWKIDPTTAIVRTTSWENVTLLGGRWFIDLGQHNPYFTYQMPFVDQPELITEIFGPDALIGIGIGVDWKLPFDWHSELKTEFGQGENAVFFATKDDSWLFDTRWENEINFTDANTLHLAASYGYAEDHINVWGVDFKYTWYPKNLDRKVFEWVGEYLGRDKFDARRGFYTHFRSEVFKEWWLQYRFDYTGLEPNRINPIVRRHTALFAWVPSEKLALRLQFDSISDDSEKNEERVLFQMNIGIGAFSENTY
jgi:hypothetical protein